MSLSITTAGQRSPAPRPARRRSCRTAPPGSRFTCPINPPSEALEVPTSNDGGGQLVPSSWRDVRWHVRVSLFQASRINRRNLCPIIAGTTSDDTVVVPPFRSAAAVHEPATLSSLGNESPCPGGLNFSFWAPPERE